MKRILTIIFCAMMIASCSEDTMIWNEEDRVKAYSAELVGKHADLIDHLDRVLRACEYRDRVLGGKDSQIVIDRYFSDAFWGLSYDEAKDELKLLLSTDGSTGHLVLKHNGTSLLESGAKWEISGLRNRIWYHESQPEHIEYSFSIENKGGCYELKGKMVFNGKWEEYFTEYDFDYEFVISEMIVNDETSVNGQPDARPVWKYVFNGNSSVVTDGLIDADKKERPETYVTVSNLEGYNHNEYHMGVPIYSSGYFSKGVISAVYGTGKDAMDLRLNINGGSWKAVFNGTEYTLY